MPGDFLLIGRDDAVILFASALYDDTFAGKYRCLESVFLLDEYHVAVYAAHDSSAHSVEKAHFISYFYHNHSVL